MKAVPKPRRPSRKSLVRKADKAFSRYIRSQYKACVVCGETDPQKLCCGHLFSRIAYSTRWEPMNAAVQCCGCNLRHEHDAGPFTLWFIRRYGLTKYEELHRRYSTVVKFNDMGLMLIADHFEGQIEKELAGVQ